MHMYTFMLQEH